MAEKPSVMIATPTTKELVGVQFYSAVSRICYELGRHGFGVGVQTTEGHDVAHQRDLLADAFLGSAYTHLLFIDSDNAVAPEAIFKLLSFRRPLVAIAIPWRALDYAGMEKLIKAGTPAARAATLSHEFNVTGVGRREGELIAVEAIGTGIMLIERGVFDAIQKHCPLERYFVRPGNRPVVGFFNRLSLPSGERLSEDFSFCRRYRDAGGEIWAYPSATVTHSGNYNHVGRFDGKCD